MTLLDGAAMVWPFAARAQQTDRVADRAGSSPGDRAGQGAARPRRHLRSPRGIRPARGEREQTHDRRVIIGDENGMRTNLARSGARAAAGVLASRSMNRNSCPSAAAKTSSPLPAALARRRHISTTRSTASSSRSESWWVRASRLARAATAQSTAHSASAIC
jgi:hypothetical protein